MNEKVTPLFAEGDEPRELGGKSCLGEPLRQLKCLPGCARFRLQP